MAENDLEDAILGAWRTSNRVTTFLVERLPSVLWGASVPGVPRRTVRMIASHIHNSRCMWIRTLGRDQGIVAPERVDSRSVTRRQLTSALNRSSRGLVRLLELGVAHGGRVPAPATYVWRNLPLDIGHVLAYFVAHEGHHRGQIVLIARQLGHRLPVSTTGGLWQWTRLGKEANS
jgi:uncharacterized damage-inducible protein DinB